MGDVSEILKEVGMTALKAVGVSRGYAGVGVLKELDFELKKGAFEALMGPSGCGKSTFLNLAAGLIGTDGGSITVGGEEITAMSDSAAARFRRRHIGFVFQDFNLLEEKSVRENILLPIKLDRVKIGEEVILRLDRLVSSLGLKGKLGSMPGELSGGERQRVAIARSLIASPDVVLADEPTGNLDVDSARSICRMLRNLNREETSAILLVTHDPMVAAAADRVNFIKDGKIAESFETGGDASRVSKKYLEVYG